MKKTTKKLCLLLTGILTLQLAGCGAGDGDGLKTAQKDVFYRAEKIPLPEGINVWQLRVASSGITLFDVAENGPGRAVTLDFKGNIMKEVAFEDAFIAMDISADGYYWGIVAAYDESDPEAPVLNKYTAVQFDKDGSVAKRLEFSGEFGKNEDLPYPNKLIVDDQGYFYVQSFKAVYVFDQAGDFIFEVPADKGNDEAYLKSIFKLKDGRVAACAPLYGSPFSLLVQVISPTDKSVEEYNVPVAGGSYDSSFATGTEYDALLCDNVGIYEYELATENKTQVFDCLKYGLDISKLADFALLADGSIVAAILDDSRQIAELFRYAPADPSEPGEVKTITLAALQVDAWLKTYIADFNKNNPGYKIETVTYSGDREDALKKFGTDLIAGNVPDLIVIDNFMPANSYISKGLFADLYGFMDSDPSFDRGAYLQGAFASLERDGQLFELFPMYWIRTLEVKASYAGDQPGWSLDEFAAFLEKHPQAVYIIEGSNKFDFITTAVQRAFIDPKTGACEFNRADFAKILQIAERFPDEVFMSDNPDDFMGLLFGAASGDPLALSGQVSRFRSVKESEALYFGEPITYKGYPGENGASFVPCARFAIAAKAGEPEGAWSFIKFMLDNYQDSYSRYLPLKLALLEQMAAEAQENPYYMQNGDRIETEYEVAYSVGGAISTVAMGNNSAADSAKVMALILSTQTVYRSDTTIYDIIAEEIGAYLDGQKPADTVADIIENRINLYVSETE